MIDARRLLSSARTALGKRHNLLALILFAGFAVRLWQFPSVPGGLNVDEASMGYDAWSLLHYGIDRNGFPFPVFLVAWGSGMNALASYLSMPFIWLFGLNVFSVRIVNLLAGLLTLPLWYATVKKVAGEKTAVLALFLLAVCPWHIMLSRWGLESNLLPPVFLLGVFLLLHAGEKKWIYPLACVVFGVTLYAYGTAYVATPLFLAVSTAYLLWHRKISKTELLWGAGAFVIVSVPIALFLQINLLRLPSIITPFFSIPRLPGVPRYETVSVLFSDYTLRYAIGMAMNVWTVLTMGDGLLWNVIPGIGALYPWTPALAVLGLILLAGTVRQSVRSYAPGILMLLWTLSAFLMSIVLYPNLNRVNLLLLPVLYLAALGLLELWRTPFVAKAVLTLYLFCFVGFVWTYFGNYALSINYRFRETLGIAIRGASAGTDERICVTDESDPYSFPYIRVLFEMKIPPREYLATRRVGHRPGEFEDVKSFGRYAFGLRSCLGSYGAYVMDPTEAERVRGRALHMEHYGDYIVAYPMTKQN